MSHAAAAHNMKKFEGFVMKWVKQYNNAKNVDHMPECSSCHSMSHCKSDAYNISKASQVFITLSKEYFIKK